MLAYAYGSPNWTMWGLSGHSCFTPKLAAGYVIQGDFTFPDAAQFLPDRYDDPEYVPPKCVMSWGRSIGRGCTDHYWADHWLIDMMRRGAKVIVVDPRETWIATRADLYLKIRPGTDNALALALLNVVVEREPRRQGLRRQVVPRLRQDGRAGAAVHAGVGGAHNLDTRGQDPRGGPHVRCQPPRRHRHGPSARGRCRGRPDDS